MAGQNSYDAREIAKWFVNRADRDAGEAITHLKLQKLLYFAQAYYLANRGKPLFQEDMEAWTHGPVVPSIWHKYNEFGWEAIPPGEDTGIDDPDILAYLEAVYEHFGRFSAKELERLTHAHDPWKVTRNGLPPEAKCNAVIDKGLIREFYGKRIARKAKKKTG